MSSFWLAVLHHSHLSIALIENEQIVATGPRVEWNPEDDSIISAVDQSLSQAADNHKLSSADEPTQTAFILPPDWVGSDGKIIPSILQKIEIVCRQLKLRPMGFVGQDEAIIENLNTAEGVPSSFVLIYLHQSTIDLSLIFLGQVKQRLSQSFTPPFHPSIVETTLAKLSPESTIPPRVIVFGDITQESINDLVSYPWLGKKDIETFLQLPEINYYSDTELTKINASLVLHQLHPSGPVSPAPIESLPPPISPSISAPLSQVSPQSLGFGLQETPPSPSPSLPAKPLAVIPPRPKITLPKIPRLPSIKLKFKFNFLWPLALLPVFFVIFLLFLKTKLTLYLNPYVFSQRLPVTLSTKATTLDVAKLIIPVTSQTLTVNATASIPTTGKLTIGHKSQGEIIIYNQQNKVQNLPKGTIIVDSSGKRFELFVATSVASSSSNLDAGIVTLGQTKTVVVATDIGPDSNLPKDTKFTFKDFSDTILLAKSTTAFTGGSLQTVAAVAAADKTTLESQLQPVLQANISQKVNEVTQSNSNLIKESPQIKKGRIDYSRETNEEADTLSATVSATVTLFSLAVPRDQLITALLTTNSTLPQLDFNTNLSTLTFDITKAGTDQSTAYLNIQSQALPQLNLAAIQKKLVAKTPAQAATILKSQVDRLYDFRLHPNFLLPLNSANIIIEVQTTN